MSSLPPLGDLEIAVLEDLWATGVADAKSVHSRIGERRSISLSTVQSTLERLYRKHLLQRDKVSHAYQYSPAVDRSTLVSRLIQGAVGRVAHGEPNALIAAFVDLASQAGESELDRLEALIAEYRANQRQDES